MLTINWEALTFKKIIATFYTSIKKVSIGSIAGMVVNQLHEIVSSKDQPQQISGSDDVPNERSTSDSVITTNPFEKANAEEEDNTGVPKEKAEPINAGFFSLISKGKIRDIFSAENLTMVVFV